MHLREELSRLFDYEQWATMRWIEPAKALGMEEVLLHIIDAQSVWLSRIEGRHPWSASIDTLPMDLDKSVRGWQRLLLGEDLSRVVPYVNSQGIAFENSVLEITRQVLEHGMYHRGQLRGAAGERGLDFPETDYILFCRDRVRVGVV